MNELATAALFIGLVAYSIAATLFFVDLARRDAAPTTGPWAPRLLILGAIAQAIQVCLASLVTRTCPVESLAFALSLSALLIIVCYLILRQRWKVDALGVAAVPIALTLLVGAQFVGQAPRNNHQTSTLLILHVTSNLFGLGLFLLAGAAGAFYLLQERRLRSKLMPSRLPALDALDRAEHRFLLAGFPLQTLGAISGGAFIAEGSSTDPLRFILAYATWALIAAVLLLRSLAGWHGRRTAYGTVAGAACVLVLLVLYVIRSRAGA